jgi:hypothetical protein
MGRTSQKQPFATNGLKHVRLGCGSPGFCRNLASNNQKFALSAGQLFESKNIATDLGMFNEELICTSGHKNDTSNS